MSDELVFDRAIALLAASERHIDDHMAAYSDRDDMAGTRLLLETLHRIVEDAQGEVIAIQRFLEERTDATAADRERRLRKVRKVARDTAWLVGQPLHYATSPHGREFDPLAIAYGRMARAIEPKTQLIFRGSEHRGYALSPPLLSKLTDNVISRASGFAEQIESLPTILYLQYPAIAEGDVLQHLLIAHEVAHLALRKRAGRKRRSEAEDRFETAILTWKEEAPEAHAAIEDGVARRESREQALRWFTEIASDILAVRLAGPAYYLALCEHALVRQWFYRPSDGETNTHPHLAWRLQRAEQHLEYFYKAMSSGLRRRVAKVIEPYAEIVPSAKRQIEEEPYGRVIELALDALEHDLDGLSLLGEAGLRPTELAEDLQLVLQRLEAGLAPTERIKWTSAKVRDWSNGTESKTPPWSEPLDWRSILNGGYFHLLESPSPSGEPFRGAWRKEDERRRHIVDHLRGAVELSEFQRAAVDVGRLRLLEVEVAA